MEFEKAKELFKKNTETMAAYSHAMGVLSYDSETAAPKNSAEGLGRTYGVLSEIIYKLTVNEEQFEVIDTMMSNLDKLDFITRREVEEKARELNQMRKIPMLLGAAAPQWLISAKTPLCFLREDLICYPWSRQSKNKTLNTLGVFSCQRRRRCPERPTRTAQEGL